MLSQILGQISFVKLSDEVEVRGAEILQSVKTSELSDSEVRTLQPRIYEAPVSKSDDENIGLGLFKD